MSLELTSSDFLKRALAFKSNRNVLTPQEFDCRKAYLVETLKSTKFYAKVESPDSTSNPFADVNTNEALMNMAKGNIMNYIPQTVIMAWVNFFFAGSVVMKLPFPLTDGFKSMLQSGVNTPDLNARYVSAISWYFVNLFGLRPVYSLIMDDPAAVEELMAQSLQSQQGNALIGSPGAPKAGKIFDAESESLQILEHQTIFDDISNRVLERHTDS